MKNIDKTNQTAPNAIGIEGRIYPIYTLSAAEKQDVLETIKTVLSLRFGCTEESITLKFL